jgi:hypothetical protein
MTYTYEDWVEHSKDGQGGQVDSLAWLDKGCPKCNSEGGWQVTNDGWCYCDGCAKGYPTRDIFTNWPLEHYEDGKFSCFMCEGTKITQDGMTCMECLHRYD